MFCCNGTSGKAAFCFDFFNNSQSASTTDTIKFSLNLFYELFLLILPILPQILLGIESIFIKIN